MPNPTAPHQTNQKIADAHTVLKLCTGKNKNSMGAKFKCGVQCNSACAVQEHSVFSPGWETLCKVHCYVQLRRMLYFCQGRNTNGGRWALIHSASFLPSSSLCLQPFQSSSSSLWLQPFHQSSSTHAFLYPVMISRLPCRVFCIFVLTYQKCN